MFPLQYWNHKKLHNLKSLKLNNESWSMILLFDTESLRNDIKLSRSLLYVYQSEIWVINSGSQKKLSERIEFITMIWKLDWSIVTKYASLKSYSFPSTSFIPFSASRTNFRYYFRCIRCFLRNYHLRNEKSVERTKMRSKQNVLSSAQ